MFSRASHATVMSATECFATREGGPAIETETELQRLRRENQELKEQLLVQTGPKQQLSSAEDHRPAPEWLTLCPRPRQPQFQSKPAEPATAIQQGAAVTSPFVAGGSPHGKSAGPFLGLVCPQIVGIRRALIPEGQQLSECAEGSTPATDALDFVFKQKCPACGDLWDTVDEVRDHWVSAHGPPCGVQSHDAGGFGAGGHPQLTAHLRVSAAAVTTTQPEAEVMPSHPVQVASAVPPAPVVGLVIGLQQEQSSFPAAVSASISSAGSSDTLPPDVPLPIHAAALVDSAGPQRQPETFATVLSAVTSTSVTSEVATPAPLEPVSGQAVGPFDLAGLQRRQEASAAAVAAKNMFSAASDATMPASKVPLVRCNGSLSAPVAMRVAVANCLGSVAAPVAPLSHEWPSLAKAVSEAAISKAPQQFAPWTGLVVSTDTTASTITTAAAVDERTAAFPTDRYSAEALPTVVAQHDSQPQTPEAFESVPLKPTSVVVSIDCATLLKDNASFRPAFVPVESVESEAKVQSSAHVGSLHASVPVGASPEVVATASAAAGPAESQAARSHPPAAPAASQSTSDYVFSVAFCRSSQLNPLSDAAHCIVTPSGQSAQEKTPGKASEGGRPISQSASAARLFTVVHPTTLTSSASSAGLRTIVPPAIPTMNVPCGEDSNSVATTNSDTGPTNGPRPLQVHGAHSCHIGARPDPVGSFEGRDTSLLKRPCSHTRLPPVVSDQRAEAQTVLPCVPGTEPPQQTREQSCSENVSAVQPCGWSPSPDVHAGQRVISGDATPVAAAVAPIQPAVAPAASEYVSPAGPVSYAPSAPPGAEQREQARRLTLGVAAATPRPAEGQRPRAATAPAAPAQHTFERQVTADGATAQTVLTSPDGSQRVFGETTVESLVSSAEGSVDRWMGNLGDFEIRALLHEMGQRLLQGSKRYHANRQMLEELSEQQDLTLFGLQEGAAEEELDKAYRRKAREMHPDKNGGTEEAKKNFQAMKSRYESLKKKRRSSASGGCSDEPQRPDGTEAAEAQSGRKEAYDEDVAHPEPERKPEPEEAEGRPALEKSAWKMISQLKAIRHNESIIEAEFKSVRPKAATA